ncbi:S9 family peptidase [Bacteriovoracales bacterium]|nr:S9 family peptidase [Bacteriovoracales bacterium]
MKNFWSIFILFSSLFVAFNPLYSQVPPVAEQKRRALSHHGDERIDNFYWLREKDNPEVLEYLRKENHYTQEAMIPHKKLHETILSEMVSRLGKQEDSLPYKRGNYEYFKKYKSDLEYPIYFRSPIGKNSPKEILNPNVISKEHSFFNLASMRISPDEKYLAYAVDIQGRNFFTLFIKNLKSGTVIKTEIKDIAENFEWANDNETLFYTKQDPETLRWDKIFRYSLKSKKHELIIDESDEKYWVNIRKSKTNSFIFFESEATLTSETYFIDANTPKTKPVLLSERSEGHFYTVFDGGDRFLIKTNLKAENYRLMELDFNNASIKSWKEVMPHREDVLLETIEQFKEYIVFKERKNGLVSYRVYNRKNGEQKVIPFTVNPATPYILENYDFESRKLRFSVESLSLPETIYEYDMGSEKQVLLKQKKIGTNFNSNDYVSTRLFALSRDGVNIPVSIVYKKGLNRNGLNPVLIYAYGAYGDNVNPYFEQEIFSLLDRGFVYAVANVRGGSEMGQYWYDNGKMLNKKNTFYDFIDVTEYLIKEKYTSPKKVYAWGMSAGGLLVGAVANMRPDLYNGIYAQVPFVDTLTTMLDPSIPLTIGEYDEWGNPEDKVYYDYIKSYSPYDNIVSQEYPHMFVTGGFYDSQVQYWEPAKWVAKLRTLKTDNNLLLLHTDMNAGHGGASGRVESLKQLSFGFSFLVSLEKDLL